jgi:hypothetical protein
MAWEYALVILAVVASLWTVAAIVLGSVVYINLSRSTRRIDGLLRDIELHLGPALLDLRETLRNVNKTSAGVADGVAQAGKTFEAIGDLGKTLHGANTVLRAALGPSVTVAASLLVGARAGFRVLARRLFRRR